MEKVGRGQPPRFGPRSVPQRWNEQTHRTSRSASSSGVEARGPLADGVTRHQQKPPRRGIPSCFNCGGLGHIQMNCPSARNVRADADERRKVAVVKRAPAAPEDAKPPETEAPVGADMASFLTARVAELRGSNLELARDAPPPRSSKAYQGQNIELACEGKEFTALLDSGCEISVIHTDVVPECYKKATGKINLVSAFGETVCAQLINLPLKRLNSGNVPAVTLTCAMTDRLTTGVQALLTPDDWGLLKETSTAENGHPRTPTNNERVAVRSIADVGRGVQSSDEVAVGADGDESADNNTDSVCISDEAPSFKHEQLDDPSLLTCWSHARNASHGMIIKDGLLFHVDEQYGRKVMQLVLPINRRKDVISLAHQGPWAGHLGSRKTLQRIRASFFWPGMSKEVREFVQSCKGCQLHSSPRILDRTPIAPLTRPEEPFSFVVMDIVGPIEPPSARGHRYILTIVDVCTRYPEAVCLRSITAEATCLALLEIFSRLGIPNQVASNQGSNFTAELTQLLFQRLGVEIYFSAPYHYESHGVVERFNRTLRDMLSHVVDEYGRGWDRMIPYLLWAYRETPNETTGVPPFLLMYGRSPRGPLSVLRDNWTGEVEPPVNLNTPTADFLTKIRRRFATALEIAKQNADVRQADYVSRYNLRARAKTFEQGDSVLIRKIQPNNKLSVKWDGPATIVKRERADSYLVRMEDGSTRWVHANMLRTFQHRVAAVGIAFEADSDFGEVECFPTQSHDEKVFNPEQVVQNITGLDRSQKQKLYNVLNEFREIFSERPGRLAAGEHNIEVQPDFVARASRPYNIPIALRNEVERQIHELMRWEMIEPSNSRFSHPLVCVAKKDGGLRLCVDFRYLNSGTIADAFPAAHPQELIMQVAKARFISLLDMTRGYWQVPMAESSKQFTAFSTPKGLYQWKVMPFGLRNASATFQRLMNRILAKHTEYASAYLDDVAVYSETFEAHLVHLRAVLLTLKEHGATIKGEKCSFACNTIKYLGHIVGSGLHSPDPERIEAITKLSQPTTKKEVRSFLGICGYYRQYIPNFAEIARPLTDLTSRRVPNEVPWPEAADKAFKRLKEALKEIPVLHSPDVSRPFLLFTDASQFAVGACLAQMNERGEENPISFISQKFNAQQERWSTIEKEAYGIVWALKRFNSIIYGTKVMVVSDHNPLSFLTVTSPRSPKLLRWALALQQYDIKIVYRKGNAHINADALSRLGHVGTNAMASRTD